jgi:hypothetical protein
MATTAGLPTVILAELASQNVDRREGGGTALPGAATLAG